MEKANIIGTSGQPPRLPRRARARQNDPDTSHHAATIVTPHLRKLQGEVLDFAIQRGGRGFTDRDMERHFNSSLSTYRTRRAELAAMGYLEDSGNRISFGGKGRRFALWRVTALGITAAAMKKAGGDA